MFLVWFDWFLECNKIKINSLGMGHKKKQLELINSRGACVQGFLWSPLLISTRSGPSSMLIFWGLIIQGFLGCPGIKWKEIKRRYTTNTPLGEGIPSEQSQGVISGGLRRTGRGLETLEMIQKNTHRIKITGILLNADSGG